MENLMNVTLSKKQLLMAAAATILVFMLAAVLVVGGVFLRQTLGQLSQPEDVPTSEQQLQAQIDAQEKQLAAKEAELAALRSTAADPGEIERLEAENLQLTQTLEESQAALAQLQAEKQTVAAEKQDLTAQVEQLTQEKAMIINNYSRRFVVVVKVLEHRLFTEHDSGIRYKAYMTAEEYARIEEGDTLAFCPGLDITSDGSRRIVVVEKYVAELPGVECPAI